MDFEKHILEL